MSRPVCRKIVLVAYALTVGSIGSTVALAQNDAAPAAPANNVPFTLIVTGEINDRIAPIAGRLTTLFYQCYPRLVRRFENPTRPAPREIHLIFLRGLKVPAACRGADIRISVDWLEQHPDDLGLLTHELTHTVQAYPSKDPLWLTEGLADYARHLYGPKEQPGWALPATFSAQQSYQEGYRVTGRFLLWLDRQHPGVVDKLHRRMQEQKFELADFQTLTGQSIDELWKACVSELSK